MADKHLIHVCIGSYCEAHKARKVAKRLEGAIKDAGACDMLRIKKCGCMHRCKKGPYVAFKEKGLSFSHVKPGGSRKVVKKVLQAI